jgi:hypothetical protein
VPERLRQACPCTLNCTFDFHRNIVAGSPGRLAIVNGLMRLNFDDCDDFISCCWFANRRERDVLRQPLSADLHVLDQSAFQADCLWSIRARR